MKLLARMTIYPGDDLEGRDLTVVGEGKPWGDAANLTLFGVFDENGEELSSFLSKLEKSQAFDALWGELREAEKSMRALAPDRRVSP